MVTISDASFICHSIGSILDATTICEIILSFPGGVRYWCDLDTLGSLSLSPAYGVRSRFFIKLSPFGAHKYGGGA